MRTALRRLVKAGVLAGLAYAAWRAWQARVSPAPDRDVTWESAPFPFPPVPRPAGPVVAATDGAPDGAAAALAPFTDPAADGSCPPTHPVKAKLASGIFHVPGGANYDRTKPDRCYATAEAALADGLRPAKR